MQGASSTPTYICWNDGNKHLAISFETWCILDHEERIAHAKEDLRKAGFEAAAGILGAYNLEYAFRKIPTELRKKVLEHRRKQQQQQQQDGVRQLCTRKRLREQEREKQAEEVQSGQIYRMHIRNPSFHSLLSETIVCEEEGAENPLLLLRLSLVPHQIVRIDQHTVEVTMQRESEQDLAAFLIDKKDDAKRTALVDHLGGTERYDEINAAFARISGQVEKWHIRIELNKDYQFNEETKTTLVLKNQSKNCAVILFSLVHKKAEIDQATTINF